MCSSLFFFFFKQKTAYEMRISDWSSDVCSSDLRGDLVPRTDGTVTYGQLFALQPFGNGVIVMDLTGAQLKRLLEQQFIDAKEPNMLMPSAGDRKSVV